MRKELSFQENQQQALEVLKKVADICEKKGLKYYLVYGTLIGAIRHKDFIPWDDDIDIMMPRKDYEELLNYFHDENPEGLELFEPKTKKNYPYMIARVCDTATYIETHNEVDCGMGVFIDIYPFDGLGNTREEAVKFGLKGDLLSSLCYQSTRKHFEVGITKGFLRVAFKFPLYVVAKLFGHDYWRNKLLKLEGVKAYDENKYVGCVVWLTGGERDMFEREWFGEGIVAPFGKYEFRVPTEYDKMLRNMYGDYMQLPPESERVGHHNYKVYYKS